jgi:signal transduction histidine kinase/DNA-binding response OmpR family regulator
MGDFKRFLLVFIIPFIVLGPISNFTSAQESNVEQLILDIEQMADKKSAVIAADNLLKRVGLSEKQKIALLMTKSVNFLSLADFEQGIITIKKAHQLSIKNNLPKLTSDTSKLLGILYYYQGDNIKSLKAYNEALNFYPIDSFPIKRANLLNNIGLVHSAMANFTLALQNYFVAEPLYEKYGSDMDKVDIRYNIAGLYIHLKRYDVAITMLLDVIKKRELINDVNGKFMAYADIGISYMHAGSFEYAQQYAKKALDYFQQNDNQYNAASQFHNLSRLHLQMGDIQQAQQYANDGIILSKQIGHKKAYIGCLQTLVEVNFRQGNLNLALENLTLSNEIAEKMGYATFLNSNLALLSLVYAAQNNTEQALKVHYQYIRDRNKAPNDMLNQQLAKFESEMSAKTESKHLIEQVEQLQASKKMQQLEAVKEDQQRNFAIIALALFLVVGFFLYRRSVQNQLTDELEIKVKQRTQELEFLTQELQGANDIKSQFLANMSHEMRTPLTAVIGQSEAIINGDINVTELSEEVNVILNNSQHLLHLINDILDLSKIEANKLELEVKQQNLHFIIKEMAVMFTEQASKKGLAFEISHALPTPFILNVDGLRLKQILINFCSNAIKFTSKGKITLDIAQLGNELIFTVSDTGIGMNDEQMTNIFQSFTQGDSSISRRFGGSGLGLFLSEQIARVMGGTIDVESRLNHGSIFTLYLPFSSPIEVDNTAVEYLAVEQEQIINLYHGKILLAEDHHDNRRLIARLLAGLGLEVLEACNGIEAVEFYEKYQPNLILMDIQMPEMDGVEAFKKIRGIDGRQAIYALTANAMSHEVEKYLTLGFDGHLKKPIERKHFIATIAKYYGKNSEEKNKNSVLKPEDIYQFKTEEDAEKVLEQVDFSDLINDFKNNLVADKKSIIYYASNNNLSELAQEAHRMAGAAQMFGFAELTDRAIKIELAVKNNQQDSLARLTKDLLNEIEKILL